MTILVPIVHTPRQNHLFRALLSMDGWTCGACNVGALGPEPEIGARCAHCGGVVVSLALPSEEEKNQFSLYRAEFYKRWQELRHSRENSQPEIQRECIALLEALCDTSPPDLIRILGRIIDRLDAIENSPTKKDLDNPQPPDVNFPQ